MLALAVPKIFHGCEILKLVTWPWPRPLRGQLVILWPNHAWNLKSVALAVPKIFHWV